MAFGHGLARAWFIRDSCSPFGTIRQRHAIYVGAVLRDHVLWKSMSDKLLTFCEQVPDVFIAYILLTRYDTYPEMFDYEIGMGGQNKYRSRDESDNRLSWAKYGNWINRHLRDVYPINILRNEFLERVIEGTTLRKWILADPRRGAVEPLTKDVTVWRPDCTHLPELRRRLFVANLLHWHGFYYRRDGSRIYEPNDRLPDEVPAMFDTPDEFFGDIPITR